MTTLVAKGLTKRYGSTTVLKDVDLTVEGGQVHAIVGENGAGKSTFVKIVAGIVPHGSYEGTVELDGEKLAFSSVHAGSEVGVVMVPQELHVVAHLSIAENMFASRLPGRRGLYDSRAAVKAARESLNFTPKGSRAVRVQIVNAKRAGSTKPQAIPI